MRNLYYTKDVVTYLKGKSEKLIDAISKNHYRTPAEKFAEIEGIFLLISHVEADAVCEEETEAAAELAKKVNETTYDPEL